MNPCDEWWKHQIKCDDNTFKIHPDSITYCANAADGNDSVTGNWVNVPKTYTNSVKR